jgi:nucleotide-binding universal stress UspA family protein
VQAARGNSVKKILVTHDGSKASDKALRKAVEIGNKFESTIMVLSVVPELYLTELSDVDRQKILETMTEETRNAMEKIRAQLAGKSIDTKIMLRQGDPAEKILETAKKLKVDLIVTGSHGRHGAKKFLLGSVSSRVVDYATCPVLVVK